MNRTTTIRMEIISNLQITHNFLIHVQLFARKSIFSSGEIFFQNLPHSFFWPIYAYNSQTKIDFAFNFWVMVPIIILLLMIKSKLLLVFVNFHPPVVPLIFRSEGSCLKKIYHRKKFHHLKKLIFSQIAEHKFKNYE